MGFFDIFKSGDKRLTDAQADLAASIEKLNLQYEKQDIEQRRLARHQSNMRAVLKQERRNKDEERKQQAKPHLEAMLRYLNRLEVTEEVAHRANLIAIIHERQAKCAALGISVEPNTRSVEGMLDGYR